MTYRRLRWLAFLFDGLTLLCAGLVIMVVVYDFGEAPVPVWFYGFSVALPIVFGLIFGVVAGWFDRQKRALRKKWEEQFKDTDRVLSWTACSLEYYEREVLCILWGGETINTQLSREYITYRFKVAALAFRSCAPFRASESIFELLLKEGLVAKDENTGCYVLSDKLVRGAKESHPLNSFRDPSVRVPFFTGRSFQTA